VTDFVPAGFQPPRAPDHEGFRVRPLGVEHNASDHAAWSSSIDHIQATPGFAGRDWPHPMSIDENRVDLERHAADFTERTGFTYTVLESSTETVIGCVYIYPDEDDDQVANVRSWVREADADLDPILYRAVTDWLAEAWPFERVVYAPRP
jgi:hypothetical protein